MGGDVASQRFPSLFSAKFASELIFMLSVTLAGRHLNVYSSGWSKVESAMRSTSKQCSVENLNVSGTCKFGCKSIAVSIGIW